MWFRWSVQCVGVLLSTPAVALALDLAQESVAVAVSRRFGIVCALLAVIMVIRVPAVLLGDNQ